MMATTVMQTLALSETAVMLRVYLGPIRSWTNFLTDNIRGRQSVDGLRLLPCGRRGDGKSLRPVYSLQAVKDFIAKVLTSTPEAGKAPIQAAPLAIDPSRSWQHNKFDERGEPITANRSGH
jgi:hypothetical protein